MPLEPFEPPFVISTNPQVVEYRDPSMTHTNFNKVPPERRYITVLDAWEWFRAHPRVLLR